MSWAQENRYGQQAIDLLLEEEDVNRWPENVAREWSRIGQDVSSEVDIVSLEHPSSDRRVEFPPRWEHTIAGGPGVLDAPMLAYRAPPMPERALPTPEPLTLEAALVHGRLRAVDWVERTAKLVPYMGKDCRPAIRRRPRPANAGVGNAARRGKRTRPVRQP